MRIFPETPAHTLIVFEPGELVIMRNGQRGVIGSIVPGKREPHYAVRTADGWQHVENADGLIRARAYARWVSPETDWDGDERRTGERRMGERRKGERRSPQRAGPGRRLSDRRQADRRRYDIIFAAA